MANIPPPFPGPTEMNADEMLKNAAINFAYAPKNKDDEFYLKSLDGAVNKMFSENYFKKDPKTMGMVVTTMYLKSRTRKLGGKTGRMKRKIHKTRKHRTM